MQPAFRHRHRVPRTSLTPASTASMAMNWACVVLAMMRARVVLPLPEVSQKITMTTGRPESRGAAAGPFCTICSWPINSSSVRGRMARWRAAPRTAVACCLRRSNRVVLVVDAGMTASWSKKKRNVTGRRSL